MWNRLARCFGILVIGMALTWPDAPPSQAQTTTDQSAALRDLAQRLLVEPYESGTAQLLPGALPPDFPFAMPIPDEGRLLGSEVRSVGSTRYGGNTAFERVLIEAPGVPLAVLRFYQNALANLGWTPPPGTPPSPNLGPQGGFQTSAPRIPLTTSTYCSTGTQGWGELALDTNSDGRVDVRFTLVQTVDAAEDQENAPGALTSSGPPQPPAYNPCNPASQPEQLGAPPAARINPIPTLFPPSGIALEVVGQGGSSNGWSSEAVIQSQMTPADLEANFAAQLADSGWTRVAGIGIPTVAWSTWQVSGDTNWQGLLEVTALPMGDQRALSVTAYPEVFGEGAPDGPDLEAGPPPGPPPPPLLPPS